MNPYAHPQVSIYNDVMLAELKRRIREEPSLPGSLTVLPRTHVPRDALSPAALRRMGFRPSVVAVPEAGQNSIVTWRHPKNNLHFHRHPNHWIYHEDSWPSFQMLIEAERLKGNDPSIFSIAKRQPGMFIDSINHALVEGLPGYNNYLAGRVLGRTTFSDAIEGRTNPRTAVDKVGRTALMSLLAASPFLAGRRPRTAGAAAGALAGFVGAQSLGHNLGENQFAGAEPHSTRWALERLALGGLLPILGAVGGGYAGFKGTDRLLKT